MSSLPRQRGLACGARAVSELLRSGKPVHRLMVVRPPGSAARAVLDLARARAVPVQWMTREEMDRACGGARHQGIAALTAALEYVDVDQLLVDARAKELVPPLLLVLDHVEDPQNLGSLLRSANAAGATGVVVASFRAAPLSETVRRVSAGAAEYVPVARVSSIAALLNRLKERGYWVVGADPEASRLYWEADFKGPSAIVVGAEGRGMSRLVRERCDDRVRIPMAGTVASLNAAVAGALMLFEACRQRRR